MLFLFISVLFVIVSGYLVSLLLSEFESVLYVFFCFCVFFCRSCCFFFTESVRLLSVILIALILSLSLCVLILLIVCAICVISLVFVDSDFSLLDNSTYIFIFFFMTLRPPLSTLFP